MTVSVPIVTATDFHGIENRLVVTSYQANPDRAFVWDPITKQRIWLNLLIASYDEAKRVRVLKILSKSSIDYTGRMPPPNGEKEPLVGVDLHRLLSAFLEQLEPPVMIPATEEALRAWCAE